MQRSLAIFLGLLAVLLLAAGSLAQTQVELAGTYWQALEIDGKPVVAAPTPRRAHLRFSLQGRVSGSTGCNRFAGSYQRQGQILRFTPLALTKMACSPPLDDQEKAFLQALAETTTMRHSGHSLELLDAAGKVRLRLRSR